DPSAGLQPYAERVRVETKVDFITIMSPAGIRYTHPDPARIGGRFVGDIAPAQRGRPFTETYTGTLGPSVRAVVPVQAGGRIVGLVSAGVLEKAISAELADQLPRLIGLAALALALGAVLTLLVARRVKRQTLGLEPREIATLYEHHDAVLHAIREGVMVVDDRGRLQLVNDEARRLLGLPAAAQGAAIQEAVPAGSLRDLLASGCEAADALHVLGERVLVVSQRRARVDGRAIGTVTTVRDRTELEGLVRELDTVRGLADSLRAQAHESANRLHTLVGLVELGRHQDAIAFATEQAGLAQELLGRLQERVDEPALVALLLGKTASAGERGIELVLDDVDFAGAGLPPTDLVTIVGNLLDNAMDAAGDAPGARVELTLRTEGGEAIVAVRDSGPGIPPEHLDDVFEAGWTTKPGGVGGRGLGLALVRQAAARLGGTATAANDGGAVITVRLPIRERVA
ncbi:MAG TPA: sensor histidine kinase, partial [Solirubrobacteraceae bacterium]